MASHLPDRSLAGVPLRDLPGAGSSDATKERLLDAAEELLAERGFDGMSIRALVARAGTSVSSAHYHFGSKLALVSALFEARVAPVNDLRLERLDAVVAASAPDAPALEDVIESFVRPSFEAWRRAEALGRTATPHILAQLHVDRAPRLDELKRRLLEPVMDRYLAVVGRILTDHDPTTLRVGLGYVLGMLLHTTGGHLAPTLEAAGLSHPRGEESLLRHLIAFAAAGLRSGGAVAGRGAEGAS